MRDSSRRSIFFRVLVIEFAWAWTQEFFSRNSCLLRDVWLVTSIDILPCFSHISRVSVHAKFFHAVRVWWLMREPSHRSMFFRVLVIEVAWACTQGFFSRNSYLLRDAWPVTPIDILPCFSHISRVSVHARFFFHTNRVSCVMCDSSRRSIFFRVSIIYVAWTCMIFSRYSCLLRDVWLPCKQPYIDSMSAHVELTAGTAGI